MVSTKQTSWFGRRLSAALLVLALTSCGDSSSGSSGADVNAPLRSSVLASVGQSVIVPAQTDFAARMVNLESALSAAVAGSGTREDAQGAWRDAADAWQRVEMMQVGPSGSSLDVMGGQDLRARIYTWPSLNLCAIDRITASDDFADADAIDAEPGVPRGLGMVEYLLFNEARGNNCTALDPLNNEDIWDSLAGEIPARRLAQAGAVASLVRGAADNLVDAWSPNGGDFIGELTNPSRGGAVYGSAQEGLNALSDAMFYLDKETKDMKLAEPIGITGCDAARCPESVESRWAAASKAHLLANLEAFQQLFLGGTATDAPGFDDLLVEMGASGVADDMRTAIADAISATAAIPGSLREAVDADPEAVVAAHTAVRGVTDILKADFLSVLDLEAPNRAEGDND